MITIMGTVGRCCLVPADFGRALSSKHVWTLTFDRGKYVPLLACLQINYADWVLRRLAADEQGGIMSAIRSETLRSLSLPVPSLHEQHKIVAILESHNDRLEREKNAVHKLAAFKSALMHDLLTGRVRTRA
jgi:type I restriction enzyme S subunit